jgi:hypothetical protein
MKLLTYAVLSIVLASQASGANDIGIVLAPGRNIHAF